MASLTTTFIIAGTCFLLLHPSSSQDVLTGLLSICSRIAGQPTGDDLIATYFGLGLAYTEILSFLAGFMVFVSVYDNSRECLGPKVFVEGRYLPVCLM